MLHLAHVQLLDSALPVGAFSHSFGLETPVQSGRVRTPGDLEEWCRTLLRGSWAPCEALGVKGVYVLEEREIWRLDAEMDAARGPQEMRDAMRKIGRRLLSLGRAIHPALRWEPLAAAIAARRCPGAFPTVYGWACRELGVERDAAAQGFLYACVASTINASVRLMRVGQTEAQSLLARLLPAIEAAWHEVRDRSPWEFATATPEADIAAMQHETLEARLFMS